MKNMFKIASFLILIVAISSVIYTRNDKNTVFPNVVTIQNIAQNPEGIEYNKDDNTFLLSSLNAAPILKVKLDGTSEGFTSGEKNKLATACLQIDSKRNRLLAAGFSLADLIDNDPKTKGSAVLRVYNLKSGILEKDINLSHLIPDASAYFANDIAIDNDGNTYITDWYAGVIYKVDIDGNASIFWANNTGKKGEPNGIDFNDDGYLLVSLLAVNKKGMYSDYGLVKIPVKNAEMAKIVKIDDTRFTGFDGLVVNNKGNVVGVTNDQKSAGGNTLIELSSDDSWKTATVVNSKSISASTTLTITPENKQYVINQDFTSNTKKTWNIKQVKF